MSGCLDCLQHFWEIMNKFDIHFIRLSLVLQIMEDHNANTISLSAVKGAAKLCSYYQSTAMKVLKILENPGYSNTLQKNKEVFYKTLPEIFTTAEANNIGGPLHFNIKAVQRFLDSPNLFEKVSHGKYSKKAVS